MNAESNLRPARPGRRAARFLLPATLALGLSLGLAGCKSSEEKAAEYYQSGLDLLAEGDVDRAIVQFRNVFEIDGTHYDARKTLAETLLKKGDARGAYSQYLRLAEQYPDDPQIRIALARMAYEAGNSEEFDRHTARAVELLPDSPEVQALDLGRRYREAVAAKDDEARNQLAEKAQDLLKTRPEDSLLLAIMLDKTARDEDLEQSDELTSQLMELEPDNRLRYRQRLALLVEQGDMAAVEAHLRATVKQFPDDNEAKAALISFYLSQKQNDKAEAYLRELAAAAPADEPGPQIDLLRLLETTKGRDAARAELEKIIAAGGDPLIFRTLRAGFDFADGKRDEAVAEIRQALEGTEPSEQTRNIRVQLARMLLDTGDIAGAKAEVATILAEDPAQAGALKLQARWDIEADKTDDALLALRSALDQDGQDAEAMSLMADAYFRAGEADLARDYLAQAATASGNAVAPSLRLARVLVEQGRWRPAEDAILPALQKAPDNIDLLGLLGQIYISMPDMPRAGDVIKRLRELGGDQATALADQLELQRLNSEKGAEAALDQLAAMAGAEDAGLSPRVALIRARLATGDTAEALTLAQALAADMPDSLSARLILAMTRLGTGDVETGQAELEQIIADHPNNAAPHLALARLATTRGDLDAAALAVDRGLEAVPGNPDLQWMKAGLAERKGDIDGAIAIYEELYARNSSAVVIANNLASLLATSYGDDPEKLARAAAVSRRLKDTTVPAFMDTYGWIQHLNGDNEAALPYLEGAAAGLTDDIAVQIHLGLVQDALGQTEPARAQLSKALAMPGGDGTGREIEAARAALTRLGGPVAETAPEAGQAAD